VENLGKSYQKELGCKLNLILSHGNKRLLKEKDFKMLGKELKLLKIKENKKYLIS